MQLVRNNWIASQSRKQKSMKATTFPRRLPVKQRKRKISGWNAFRSEGFVKPDAEEDSISTGRHAELLKRILLMYSVQYVYLNYKILAIFPLRSGIQWLPKNTGNWAKKRN